MDTVFGFFGHFDTDYGVMDLYVCMFLISWLFSIFRFIEVFVPWLHTCWLLVVGCWGYLLGGLGGYTYFYTWGIFVGGNICQRGYGIYLFLYLGGYLLKGVMGYTYSYTWGDIWGGNICQRGYGLYLFLYLGDTWSKGLWVILIPILGGYLVKGVVGYTYSYTWGIFVGEYLLGNICQRGYGLYLFLYLGGYLLGDICWGIFVPSCPDRVYSPARPTFDANMDAI